MIKPRKYYVNHKSNTTYYSRCSILFDGLLPSLNEYGTFMVDDRAIKFNKQLLNTDEFIELIYGDNIKLASYLTKDLYIIDEY